MTAPLRARAFTNNGSLPPRWSPRRRGVWIIYQPLPGGGNQVLRIPRKSFYTRTEITRWAARTGVALIFDEDS